MEIVKIKSIRFNRLKGLKEIEINFSDTITAIMGVNGAGKSTVLHALACIFKSDNNHQFKDFFVPNSDSLWDDSKFTVVYEVDGKEKPPIEYTKAKQWLPQSDRRPSREVYYIGIESCLPEIEKRTSASQILYKSTELEDKISLKILSYMSRIFDRQYDALFDNELMGSVLEGPPDIEKMKSLQHLSGIRIKGGPKYSSISMGAGEQRVYKLLMILLNAKPSSLLLIDEIDLLLHISALRILLEIIEEIANNRNMQIVFTTHSLDIISIYSIPKIQYIFEEQSELTVYDQITDELVFDLTGVNNSQPKYRLYVEDTLAKEVIRRLVKNEYGNLSDFDIITFGSIENAFTLAASFVLDNSNHCNDLIILDGDKYISEVDKIKQLKSKITGTEDDIEKRREKAMSFITQFNLPESVAPEKFLYDLIISEFPHSSQGYNEARRIKRVDDSHEYLYIILQKLGYRESDIVEEIFKYCNSCEVFENYIKTIKERIKCLSNEILPIG